MTAHSTASDVTEHLMGIKGVRKQATIIFTSSLRRLCYNSNQVFDSALHFSAHMPFDYLLRPGALKPKLEPMALFPLWETTCHQSTRLKLS